MKRLAPLILVLLTGCGSFQFRPFAMLVCTSACTLELKPPADAASGVSK